MNSDIRTKKILMIKFQNHTKRFSHHVPEHTKWLSHHDEVGFISGMQIWFKYSKIKYKSVKHTMLVKWETFLVIISIDVQRNLTKPSITSQECSSNWKLTSSTNKTICGKPTVNFVLSRERVKPPLKGETGHGCPLSPLLLNTGGSHWWGQENKTKGIRLNRKKQTHLCCTWLRPVSTSKLFKSPKPKPSGWQQHLT